MSTMGDQRTRVGVTTLRAFGFAILSAVVTGAGFVVQWAMDRDPHSVTDDDQFGVFLVSTGLLGLALSLCVAGWGLVRLPDDRG